MASHLSLHHYGRSRRGAEKRKEIYLAEFGLAFAGLGSLRQQICQSKTRTLFRIYFFTAQTKTSQITCGYIGDSFC
jgi:hypothetical protein